MADLDVVTTPNENDFIRQHVEDKLYKTIVKEITGRNPSAKETKKNGQKLALTETMLRDFLYYVSMGVELKDAAEAVNLAESTRQGYQAKSPTFKRVTTLAKNNVSLRARITVAKAIMGQLPQYYKLVHPDTQAVKYVELKEIAPNVAVAQWWLETVDKIGGAEDSEAPRLGAPQNEKEAALLEMLLNKHSDYVEAKKKNKK